MLLFLMKKLMFSKKSLDAQKEALKKEGIGSPFIQEGKWPNAYQTEKIEAVLAAAIGQKITVWRDMKKYYFVTEDHTLVYIGNIDAENFGNTMVTDIKTHWKYMQFLAFLALEKDEKVQAMINNKDDLRALVAAIGEGIKLHKKYKTA